MIEERNVDLYKDKYEFRIGKFHKVSFAEFKKDWLKTFDRNNGPEDESLQDDARAKLAKIADIVKGIIGDCDLEDALDLLYQVKDVVEKN